MSQTDQLSVILENILNPDDKIRKSSENQINQFLDQNFGEFFIELSRKISTESEKKQIRQISATLIKNMIKNPKYTQKWSQLSDEMKKIIKDNIKSTLASQDLDIRKAAALAIAGICKIEIPKGLWLDIFSTLINTCLNDNLYIQLSSLTTLEYIYEEINRGDIPDDTVSRLLNTYYSILSNDNANPELILTSLKSVNKFLPFINHFVNNQTQRIQFYDLIEKYTKNIDEKIRHQALLIFIDICRIYYDSLECYIEKIFDFTMIILEKDIEMNKILCIELWREIGYEEDFRMNEIKNMKKSSFYFLQKYFNAICQKCLIYIVTENYDNDDYDLSRSCSNLLHHLSRTCQYSLIQNIIKYIGENIHSQQEKMRYAALNVFKSIIGTIHKDQFYNIVKDSLASVSDILLRDIYPFHFKKLAAHIMKNITKEYGEKLVYDDMYFDKMIELFLSLIDITKKEILYIIILSLNNLVRKIIWNATDKTNKLSKFISKLCESILKLSIDLSNYNKENNISEIAFNCLGTLGERSALDVTNYMKQKFQYICKMFEGSLDPKNIPNDQIRYEYQEYLAGCLSGFLLTGKADNESTEQLLKNLLNSFQIRKSLYDEGMTLIGCIATFTNEKFVSVMPTISPYLVQGLSSLDYPSICKNSIICLSDIIRASGTENNYLSDYLPLVLNILSNEQIDRNLKPKCFLIISDLYMYCPNDAFKSFDNIMKIIGGAIKVTKINFDENSDQENVLYFISLREQLIETLTCIFMTIKDLNKQDLFIPYVQCIVEYIFCISNDYASSINIIKDGLMLLGDFANAYGKNIKNLLNLETLKDMMHKVENDEIEGKNQITIDGLNFFKQSMNNLFYNN